jgi:hypothetical protein
MYVLHTDTFTATLTSPETFYQLAGIKKGLCENIDCNPLAGTFTMRTPGKYKFDGVASISPSKACIIDFAAFVNDIEIPRVRTDLSFLNSQARNTFSGSGFLQLNRGDVVSVRALSDTANVNVSIVHLNINLSRIGA